MADATSGAAERLPPCPGTPNCVCSEAGTDARHAIAPLRFAATPDAAWSALRRVIAAEPRTVVVHGTAAYLRVTFRSRVFRFVDDVELRLDAAEGVIHVRSASRVGRSDLGVNRRRVEHLRAALVAALGGG